jgi:hypothetical protein
MADGIVESARLPFAEGHVVERIEGLEQKFPKDCRRRGNYSWDYRLAISHPDSERRPEMCQLFLRRWGITSAIVMVLAACWPLTAWAQSGGCMGGQSSSGTSSSGTSSSGTSSGSSVTSQLSTAASTLQQLLQSGTLTAGQQQRVASMLRALQNAQAGGTLTASQVRQINTAMAVSRNIAARQSTGLAGGAAGAGTSAARSSALAANMARQSAALSQRSMMFARPGMR